MRRDVILALISENSKETDWARWTEGNKEFFYCIREVNIRGETVLVWEDNVPYFQMSIFYLLTTIAVIRIQVGKASLDEHDFEASINRVLEELK
jgi:hypothetical protein